MVASSLLVKVNKEVSIPLDGVLGCTRSLVSLVQAILVRVRLLALFCDV